MEFISYRKRERSFYYLKGYYNDPKEYHNNSQGSVNLFANKATRDLIDMAFPELHNDSPIGWKISKNHDNLYNLWIPPDKINPTELENLARWAKRANQFVWLELNSNLKTFFTGDELDFCVAVDFNFDFTDIMHKKRTSIGEAEYQLKYQLPQGNLDSETAKKYWTLLITEMMDCVDSFGKNHKFVVTTIPAVAKKQNKLAWSLAREIANETHSVFIPLTLSEDKPEMKNERLECKVNIWRSILWNLRTSVCPTDFFGKTVLIVDDLYQSGASIWCLADFLKKVCGAKIVFAVTAVKSMRDGDNQ